MDSDESGAFAGQIGSAMASRREPPTPNPQLLLSRVFAPRRKAYLFRW